MATRKRAYTTPEEHVELLLSEIDDLRADMAEMNSDLDAKDDTIKGLEDEKHTLNAENAELKEDTVALQSTIDDSNDDIEKFRDVVVAKNDKIGKLKDEVAMLNATIAELKAQVGYRDEMIGRMRLTITEKEDALAEIGQVEAESVGGDDDEAEEEEDAAAAQN